MSIALKENKKSIILENNFVKIEFSNKDAKVLSVINKTTGESIMGEESYFFSLSDIDGKAFETKSVSLSKNGVTVETELGKIDVKIEIFNAWYSLEVLNKLPKGAYQFNFGTVKFNYDLDDDNAYRGVGVAMTVNGNPNFFPDGYSKEIRGSCQEHLGGAKGAKVGFTVVPEPILRETLKLVCSEIDPEKGIVSKSAGPWSRDQRISFGDYMITSNSDAEYIDNNMDFFKELGVDQIDFHQGPKTFRQGDFKYAYYEDHKGWCEGVSSKLKANGMEAGLHTYAFYINPICHEILSDPKWQQQLDMEEEFTLAEDVSAEDDFIPTVESTADLSDYYGFFTRNLPYFLIGEEIVKYKNHPQGFKTCVRGSCGTKAVAHKKGEKIRHLIGCFNFFSPKPSSDLYKLVAQNTATTYNEGAFAMIYLDALDGINRHCREDEMWYHCAVFVHEIVKNCKTPPIIEYSKMLPSIWAARARMGAWDTPYRAYKYFIDVHHNCLKSYARWHLACTLGWYNYYPATDFQPGNYHTKYHHWDAVDYMGSLAVMYDYSTVFNGITRGIYERHRGYRRNVLRYRMYSDLRKANYFSEETLAKARACEHELAIIKKPNGKYTFIEKNYVTKRLYDIQDEKRNTEEFFNPFKKQTPFIRVEADMSTLGDDPMLLLPLNENKPITEQLKAYDFGGEIDLTQNLAMTVRVKGNGKKGAIGIKTRCGSNSDFGYGLYIIDTNFEGWRDFVLCEADNGDRPDFDGFDSKEKLYAIYRVGLKVDRMNRLELEVQGDVEGVCMSSIKACRQVYNVIKNPTVTIGNETVMFECELMSTDFIEWDGETAKVIDRYANEKTIWFEGTVTAPKGKFKAKAGIQSSLNKCPVNLHLTIGTTGKEIK